MINNRLQLRLKADLNLIAREVPSQRVLEIDVQAPVVANQNNRPPLNLALVLDRSGSMSGTKLDFVKLAANHVLDLLQEQDNVALVAFDDEIYLISPSTRVTSSNRIELKQRISNLRPGSTTDLAGGWLAGCNEVASAIQLETLNRALLLTDGLANVGITNLEELAQHARELSRRGISTTTFGVGEGFNEHLLEAMSNQGGGNFYYIENPSSIPELFLREFKELAAVAAREVEVNIDIPPHVNIQVMGGWRTEFSEGCVRIFLGTLVSNQTQEIYVKLLTPPAAVLSGIALKVGVVGKADSNQVFESQDEQAFQYADQKTVESAPRKRDVLERFALVHLAETANESLKLERIGEKNKANHLLSFAIEENRNFIAPMEADKYQRMSERMKNGMDEADRKQSHYNNYKTQRKRDQ